MAIFEFLGNILTSVLIGYLVFTNSIAHEIQLFFNNDSKQVVVTSESHESPLNTLKKIAHTTETLSGSVPKILLEHSEFQRAALYASKRDDTEVSPDVSRPLRDTIKDALVNIYCQYKTDTYIRTTTGTGFFINAKGVILTNAHVAQFLLLKDGKGSTASTECVIRTGDPATPKYKAELLYISPTWIFENAHVITEETPRGTGERDYALLYVSKSTDNSPLPAHFPTIQVNSTLLSRSTTGKSVFTAGYPAESLLRHGANTTLLPVVASTTIGTLYTFGSNYADIFSISESPVGEQGASGGPIVTTDNRDVIGLIVTKGDARTEGEHSLRAITLSYVDRTIVEETGFSLLQNMQGDIAHRGAIFKKAIVPFLAGILEDKIQASES